MWESGELASSESDRKAYDTFDAQDEEAAREYDAETDRKEAGVVDETDADCDDSSDEGCVSND